MYILVQDNTKQRVMIGTAIKIKNTVYVYNEKGKIICTKPADDVVGYTYRTFSIRKGRLVQVFDAEGNQLFTKSTQPIIY